MLPGIDERQFAARNYAALDSKLENAQMQLMQP